MLMRTIRELAAFCDLVLLAFMFPPAYQHAMKFWDGVIFRLCQKWKNRTWRKRRDEWGEWM